MSAPACGRAGGLRHTSGQGLLVERAFGCGACARIYAVEQAGAVKGQAFVHRPQVHGPQHAQVGGHGVPLGAACQQVVLECSQPGGRDVPEAQVAFRSRKIFHTPQHAAVDVGCTLAACGNEAVNQPLGVRLESRFFLHITYQLTMDN